MNYLKLLIFGIVFLILLTIGALFIIIFCQKDTTTDTTTEITTTPNITTTTPKVTTPLSTTVTLPKSLLYLTFPPGVYSKLMVVTGGISKYDSFYQDRSNLVEVFDLSDPLKHCTNVAQYPFDQMYASGGLGPGEIPLLCGGVKSKSSCYGLINGTWDYYTKMIESRIRFATGTLVQAGGKHKMVAVGGYHYEILGPRNSSEVLDHLGWWWMIAPMPISLSYTCLVVIDYNNWMVVGGQSSDYWIRVNSTFYYNAINDSWTPGPDLPLEVSSHACGIINKDATGRNKSSILIGGYSGGGNYLAETYLLDEGDTKWQLGPSLPYSIVRATAVSDPLGGVILVGGMHRPNPLNTIYRLEHAAAQWIRMAQQLKIARFGLGAFMVPDGYATCE